MYEQILTIQSSRKGGINLEEESGYFKSPVGGTNSRGKISKRLTSSDDRYTRTSSLPFHLYFYSNRPPRIFLGLGTWVTPKVH